MVLFFLVEVGGIEPPSCSSSSSVYPTRLVYSFYFECPYRINNLGDLRNCSNFTDRTIITGFDLSI